MTDPTGQNVGRYEPHDFPLFAAERRAFERFLRPGMVVLDLGCGNGRVTKALLGRGLRVWACDLNTGALVELRGRVEDDQDATVVCADARSLPVRSGAFDAVVFAYNGLDFLAPEEQRKRALREIVRVLKPGGVFLFSSHNPAGAVLSPRGLRSVRGWALRLRRIPGAFERYPREPRGTRLHQALPGRVIREVRQETGMRFVEMTATQFPRAVPRPMITLFSMWPSFVFVNDRPGGAGGRPPLRDASAPGGPP